ALFVAPAPAGDETVVAVVAVTGLHVHFRIAVAELANDGADACRRVRRHADDLVGNGALEEVPPAAADVGERQAGSSGQRLLNRRGVRADGFGQTVVRGVDARLIAGRRAIGIPGLYELEPILRIADVAGRERGHDEVVEDELRLVFALARP